MSFIIRFISVVSLALVMPICINTASNELEDNKAFQVCQDAYFRVCHIKDYMDTADFKS